MAKLTELLPGDSACEEAWGGDQPQLLRAGLGQAGGRGGSGQPQEGSGQPQETEGRYSALGQVRGKSMFWSEFARHLIFFQIEATRSDQASGAGASLRGLRDARHLRRQLLET